MKRYQKFTNYKLNDADSSSRIVTIENKCKTEVLKSSFLRKGKKGQNSVSLVPKIELKDLTPWKFETWTP